MKVIFLFTLLCSFAFIFSALDYTQQNNWPSTCQKKTFGSPIAITSANVITTNSKTLGLKLIQYPNVLTSPQQQVINQQFFVYSFTKITNNFVVLTRNGADYKYTFQQMQFHCPAEHTIDAYRADCEIQLIHSRPAWIANPSADPNNILVISILVKMTSTATKNPIIETTSSIDLGALLQNSRNFYFYSGGMTTPPCTENYNWLIMSDMQNMTAQQLQELKSWISTYYPIGNNRQVQTNGNSVYQVTYNQADSASITFSNTTTLLLSIFTFLIVFLMF